mmetsp:Transcript_16868/g.41830  ORF Transcript_16868/g.41830 Transcript_16868/m.41830 type:complete len:206 (+) Transcript_16868:235-852(+)
MLGTWGCCLAAESRAHRRGGYAAALGTSCGSRLACAAATILATASSTESDPSSPPLRLLSASVPPSTSSLPTTPKTGILSAAAILICLPSDRPPGSTSARSPAARALATTSLQKGRKSSLTGRRRSCVGAIQKGKSPAVLSMSTPKKRSIDPKMARCSMMGCSFSPLLATYLRSKRSGRLKSHWTVEHCHWRPMASVILMSIFGP